MKALIDGDIVARRVASTTVDQPTWIATARADDMMLGILEEINHAYDTEIEYATYLTDSPGNYRRHIYPEYKANRTQPEPPHNQYLKEYLIDKYGAIVAPEQEADDYLGIYQDKENGTTCICTIDKDLKQIPGIHYNFVTGEWSDVTEEQAEEFFFWQVMAGDSGDNIKGIPGIGLKKAQKHYDKHFKEKERTTEEYIKACLEAYVKAFKEPEEARKQMLLTGQLVRIRTVEDELWTF